MAALPQKIRYLDTPNGMAAKKRANKKYRETHAILAPARGNAEHVTAQLKTVMDLLTGDVQINQTATELWKQYCSSLNPFVTRAQYISYLPELPTVAHYIRGGKKFYKSAFVTYSP